MQTERRHGYGRNADRGEDGDVNRGSAKDEARPLIGEAALARSAMPTVRTCGGSATTCVIAIPIAFEIHYKGSDNLLVRTGEELRHSRFLRHSQGLLEKIGAAFLTVALAGTSLLVIVVLWKVGSRLFGGGG